MVNIPTVKVKSDNEQGFVVINESDFDELEHELYSVEVAEEKPKTSRRTTRK